MIRFAFDMTLRQPACAIMAAAMGADTRACSLFESELWLTYPTPDMAVYEISPEELARVAQVLNAEVRP